MPPDWAAAVSAVVLTPLPKPTTKVLMPDASSAAVAVLGSWLAQVSLPSVMKMTYWALPGERIVDR